jgi:hypothetical protein
MGLSIKQLKAILGLAADDGPDDEDDFDPTPVAVTAPARLKAEQKPDPSVLALTDQVTKLTEQLNREKQDREAERLQAAKDKRVADHRLAATALAESHKGRLVPAQRGVVVDLYVALAEDDHAHPLDGKSRVEQLGAILASAAPHNLTTEKVASGGGKPGEKPDGTHVLNADSGDTAGVDNVKLSHEDRVRLAREQNRKYLGDPVAAN